MNKIFISLFFALLFLQISFAQQDTEDVNIVVKKPSMCIEDKLYYEGGSQVYKCINGKIEPYKDCTYGAFYNDETGEWECNDNPSECVSAGKVVSEGEHCCGNLVEREDGVCVKKQGINPSIIVLLLVVGMFVVWKIFEKKK